MSDPKRLRETHAAELEGLLLQSVRGDTPPPSARARTLAAVALGAAVGTAGSAAAASSGSTVVWAVAAKWLVIGAGAGVVVAGTLVGPLRGVVEGASRAPRADSTAVAPQRSRTVVLLPSSGRSATPETPALAEPQGPSLEARNAASRAAPAEHAAPAVPLAPGRALEAAPSVAKPVPSTNTLPEEVAFLDTASRALREHDPSRAHAALDAYAARFGAGNLGPEATALRIQAFLEQGDHERAGRIAETFLAQNPHSPHAARVRSLLGIRLIP